MSASVVMSIFAIRPCSYVTTQAQGRIPFLDSGVGRCCKNNLADVSFQTNDRNDPGRKSVVSNTSKQSQQVWLKVEGRFRILPQS